ncbi:MAG TPA: hypothetical protein VD994_19660 [Prosthecobacter sp.]|nr:hypothetical protein [Prosthecobacter sp.]
MKLPFFILLTACFLAACATKPVYLGDADVVPTGSRLDFWIYHDSVGWYKSNVYVAMLPRPMIGLEARQWAESAGTRDAGLLWTHYYVIATPEELHSRPRRSPVYPRKTALATAP